MNIINLLTFIPAWFATALFIAAMLFCIHEKKRKYFWFRFIPCAVAYNVLPFVIPGSFNAGYLTAGWFSFSYLIFVIALIGIVYLCFDIKLINAVFYIAVAYAIQNTAHHLYNLVNRIINISGGEAPRYADAIIGIVTYAAMYLPYYFFLVRRIRASFNDKAKIRVAIVSTATVFVVYVLDMWLRSAGYGNIGIDIYAVITNLLLITAQAGIFKESEHERERVIIDELLRQGSKQSELNEHNVNVMNIKFHDLKHRIEAAKRGDDDIIEIEEAVDIYDAFVKSGDNVLDVVLTEKSLICKEKKIKLSIIADGKVISFMRRSDVSALFGNILENAIEAVEKLDESERMISLNLSSRKGFVVIHEDNRCDEQLEFEDGLPRSIKTDTEFHGFGTKSIRMIAEKYGGRTLMACVNGVFSLEIIIPFPQE